MDGFSFGGFFCSCIEEGFYTIEPALAFIRQLSCCSKHLMQSI